jgi:PAS domain S-box-containing protein
LRLALPGRQQPAATPTDEPPPDELFRKLPDAAVVLDRTTRRVTAWNPAAEALLGYPADKAVGLPLERLIPERVQAEFRALIGPADTASGEPLLDAHGPHELPLVRRTGQEIWGELTASALGRGSIVLVVRDRTAQRASQEALSFRARLLEAVEQAVVGTDPFGRILYWNRGAERLYGWSAEEVLGRNAGDIIVAAQFLERGREIMARLRQGESWSGEFPVRRRDGTEIPVLVTDSPIRDADGRLVGIIGVAVDLTERKGAERDRLERARLEALLLATEAAQQKLSQRLALHMPYVGQLATDPRLPRRLRPIADVVLDAVREVATRLEHSLARGESD